MNTLQVYDLGKQDFDRVTHTVQDKLIGKGDSLVFFEPADHVYALGKKAHDLAHSHLFRRKNTASIVPVERGGSITYHGPGQLVGYLLIDLHVRKIDFSSYIEQLEDSLLNCVHQLGIRHATTSPEKGHDRQIGVWAGSDKLIAMGLRLHQLRYTSHGFALNITPDLQYFHDIYPCGLKDKGSTSLQQLMPSVPSKASLMEAISEQVKNSFRYEHVVFSDSSEVV